jgi:hypothetical protein
MSSKNDVMVILLFISIFALWYVWKNQQDDYMETDPVVVRFKSKLVPTFPQLASVKMLKANSSYTIDKRKIYLCTEYNGTVYDDNMLTYVTLHDLAHVMTPEIGHGEKFMEMFSKLLTIAKKNNLWDSTQPRIENYCKSG